MGMGWDGMGWVEMAMAMEMVVMVVYGKMNGHFRFTWVYPLLSAIT
jgi:hypothetical protein